MQLRGGRQGTGSARVQTIQGCISLFCVLCLVTNPDSGISASPCKAALSCPFYEPFAPRSEPGGVDFN